MLVVGSWELGVGTEKKVKAPILKRFIVQLN
jgi:hypothetical protein